MARIYSFPKRTRAAKSGPGSIMSVVNRGRTGRFEVQRKPGGPKSQRSDGNTDWASAKAFKTREEAQNYIDRMKKSSIGTIRESEYRIINEGEE